MAIAVGSTTYDVQKKVKQIIIRREPATEYKEIVVSLSVGYYEANGEWKQLSEEWKVLNNDEVMRLWEKPYNISLAATDPEVLGLVINNTVYDVVTGAIDLSAPEPAPDTTA